MSDKVAINQQDIVLPLVELIRSKSFAAPQYERPPRFASIAVAYGTAGFRTKAADLDWVMYRMGALAVLRSVCCDSQYIGCMITASHNPSEDNGCKLVDPLGEMLEEAWEQYATELVNTSNVKETLLKFCELPAFKSHIEAFDAKRAKSTGAEKTKARLVIAHDTRPSCAPLLEAFKSGCHELAEVVHVANYGLLSTPQLHYMVRCLNTAHAYGKPTEEGYFDKLAQAFCNIWSNLNFPNEKLKYESELQVDGANGVGAIKMKHFAPLLLAAIAKSGASVPAPIFTVFNDGRGVDDELNHMCGADHVKVSQKPPLKYPPGQKYCSFDGDADRIVYFYFDIEGVFHLLDGDKISTLMATHLNELLERAELNAQLQLCIVQTAYANGSSTNYIKNVMKVNESCVPTGVKHLHHEAQKFDIGVYFEANGHGTVLFSQKAEELIESKYAQELGSAENLAKLLACNDRLSALHSLKHLKDVINQTVGDALSDLLAVELILAARNLDCAAWDALYTDLPSRQLKVAVADRNVIRTIDAERRVSQPAELQKAIDELVACYPKGVSRAFVRPSGTEDVVRVYAESGTQAEADNLATEVSRLVFDLAGGKGSRL